MAESIDLSYVQYILSAPSTVLLGSINLFMVFSSIIRNILSISTPVYYAFYYASIFDAGLLLDYLNCEQDGL